MTGTTHEVSTAELRPGDVILPEGVTVKDMQPRRKLATVILMTGAVRDYPLTKTWTITRPEPNEQTIAAEHDADIAGYLRRRIHAALDNRADRRHQVHDLLNGGALEIPADRLQAMLDADLTWGIVYAPLVDAAAGDDHALVSAARKHRARLQAQLLSGYWDGMWSGGVTVRNAIDQTARRVVTRWIQDSRFDLGQP